MSKNWFQVRREVAFLVVVAAGVGAACGGSKSSGQLPGAAGSAGTSGWTYLPPGNDAGTTAASGSGGASGVAGSSGAPGSSGSSGSGGSSVVTPTPFACNHIQPTAPGITSFDAFTQSSWTGPSNIQGGVYIYPDPFLLKPGEFLRYADPVATYSGLGVWFAGCVDASKMKGVRFSLAGNAGSTKSLQFYLVVNRNRDIDEKNLVGACVPDDPKNVWPSCRPPGVRLTVTEEPSTQTVLWSDFEGGFPTNRTDGSDILALQWSFDWSDGDPSYPADITIDDLEFVPADDSGGMGGAGGAPDNQGGAPSASAGAGAGGDGGAVP
ncbi:MAG: hypothetical protein EOO73_18190 [Myxococcales bacterium]|nr:MAG: hypothetical protein EOO73_18190 [Myxococcales bacterium]